MAKGTMKPSGGMLQPDKVDAPFDAEADSKSVRALLKKIDKRLDALEQVNEVRLRSRGLID